MSFHVWVDVYKAFHSVIAEVFRYKCMEDVSSDWWLFITYSLLFAGFGLHMLQSRHMEKSLSYSLHSLLLGENTGCKSDVVSRFFIIDSINLYIIFLSQVKKEVPLNQRASHLFAIEEYLGTSNSGCFWFRRWRAGGSGLHGLLREASEWRLDDEVKRKQISWESRFCCWSPNHWNSTSI